MIETNDQELVKELTIWVRALGRAWSVENLRAAGPYGGRPVMTTTRRGEGPAVTITEQRDLYRKALERIVEYYWAPGYRIGHDAYLLASRALSHHGGK